MYYDGKKEVATARITSRVIDGNVGSREVRKRHTSSTRIWLVHPLLLMLAGLMLEPANAASGVGDEVGGVHSPPVANVSFTCGRCPDCD